MMPKFTNIVIHYTGNTMTSIMNTNIPSLLAQRNLAKTSDALSASLSRLSTGLRINTARDDAAGYAVSRAVASKVNPMVAAQRNAANAVSHVQTLEGNLSSTTDVLQRMREITVQAMNGTATAADRNSLNGELSQLKSEALRIAGGASYNGENWFVLDSGAPKNIAIGAAKLDQSQVALISNGDPDDGILTRSYDGFSLASDAFDISGASSAEQRQGVLKALDGMISGVSTARYAVGSFQSGVLISGVDTSDDDAGLYTPSRPSVSDIDYTSELGDLRNKILQQAGVSVLSQANSLPQIALTLLRG